MDSHFWVAWIPWNSHSLGPKTTFGFWPRLDTPPDLWRIHRRPWKCWMPCKSRSWAWALVAWRPALVRLKQVAARTTQTTYHGSWVLFCWLSFQGNYLFKTIILDLTSLTWLIWLFLTWLDLMIDLFGLRTCELRSWGSKSQWTGAGAQLSRQIDCQVLGVITNQEIEWHRSILTWPWSYSNIFLSVEFYPPLDFLKTDQTQAPCLALEASPSSSSQLLPCCLSVWLLRWLAGPLGGGPAPARARRRVPRERGSAQKERLVIPEVRQRNCGSCWRRERIWWEYGKTYGKHVSLWLMVLTFWMVMSFEYWETCVLVWQVVWWKWCLIPVMLHPFQPFRADDQQSTHLSSGGQSVVTYWSFSIHILGWWPPSDVFLHIFANPQENHCDALLLRWTHCQVDRARGISADLYDRIWRQRGAWICWLPAGFLPGDVGKRVSNLWILASEKRWFGDFSWGDFGVAGVMGYNSMAFAGPLSRVCTSSMVSCYGKNVLYIFAL